MRAVAAPLDLTEYPLTADGAQIDHPAHPLHSVQRIELADGVTVAVCGCGARLRLRTRTRDDSRWRQA